MTLNELFPKDSQNMAMQVTAGGLPKEQFKGFLGFSGERWFGHLLFKEKVISYLGS